MTLNVRPSVRAVGRIAAVIPVLASLIVAGSAARAGPTAPVCAQAATLHHAALVVDYPGMTTVTRCVSFTEDSISGDQLLARSGVEYATAYSGQAVCQIDNQPAQYPATCWTASSPYWALFVSRGGASWTFSSLGVAAQTFRDGDAEGFRYEGQSDYSVPPSPAGVCPVPTPTPQPTATSLHTARPSAIAATARPASRTPAQPAAVAAATTTAAAASPTATQAAPITAGGSTASSPVRPAVAALSAPPTAPTPSMNVGAFAAAGLGSALVALLIVHATGLRRRTSRQRSQP